MGRRPWRIFTSMKVVLSFHVALILLGSVQCMHLSKPRFLKQRELISACKANDTIKLVRLLPKKKLDLYPCVDAAIRNKSFNVLEIILTDIRLEKLTGERLQEIAGQAVLQNHLGAFEAALTHPRWTFAVEQFNYMKSLDEFGWSLVHDLWTSGKTDFYEALLRLKWRESQRFIFTPIITHCGDQMMATLETFLITSSQVLINDVLYAMHMDDCELRRTLIEFMLQPRQKRRAYLCLLDAFIRTGGDFNLLKGIERLIWCEDNLPSYLAHDVAKLTKFNNHGEALSFAYECATRHSKLFHNILVTIPLVAKGQVKAGALEVMINLLFEMNEPIPFIRTALSLAILNEAILRPLRISDLGPVITSFL